MGLFDERIAYKPFEYPEYYTEGWLKQLKYQCKAILKTGMKSLPIKKNT